MLASLLTIFFSSLGLYLNISNPPPSQTRKPGCSHPQHQSLKASATWPRSKHRALLRLRWVRDLSKALLPEKLGIWPIREPSQGAFAHPWNWWKLYEANSTFFFFFLVTQQLKIKLSRKQAETLPHMSHMVPNIPHCVAPINTICCVNL